MSTHINTHWFDTFTEHVAEGMGRPKVFTAALAFVALWAVSGPFMAFSDTWQLLINTSTTVLTFLMVFLLQNTQNRDSKAIHAKLDEVIRATVEAHNEFRHIEEKPIDEIATMVADFENEGGGGVAIQ
jgi:low affinity Fe/Cu permease